MASAIRVTLVETISEIYATWPDVRFGQLLCNLASLVDMAPGAVWSIGDTSLLAEARDFLANRRDFLMDLAEARPPESPGCDPDLRPRSRQDRLEFAQFLSSFADRWPEAPFGRTLANLAGMARPPVSLRDWAGKVWDVEDRELREAVLGLDLRGGGRPIEWEPLLTSSEVASEREWVKLLEVVGLAGERIRRRPFGPATVATDGPSATNWGPEDEATLAAIREYVRHKTDPTPAVTGSTPHAVTPGSPVPSHP